MTNIIQLETEDVVAEVEGESIKVLDENFRVVYEENREVPYIYPSSDGGGSHTIIVEEGERGFARMFIENLPSPHDIENIDELDDLPFPEVDEDDDGDDDGSSGKSLFSKTDWEPYVGPQGGNGWRNVETDEVVYQAQPPGGVTLPDEFPGELVDFGGEYDSVMDVPGDQPVLANDGEGNIIAEELDDVPSDGFIFGVLEEESQEEEDSGENLEDQFSEGDEVDLSLIEPGSDERKPVEDATVTGSTDTGLFVEYTDPDSGYDESHHVPWEEVAGVDEDEYSEDEESIPEEDELEDFNEFLEQEPVMEEKVGEDSTGQQLIDETIDVWDLPETYEDVDPSDTLVGEIESTAEKFLGYDPEEHAALTVEEFLKDLPSDTMPGDVHSLLVAADEEQNGVDPEDMEPITDGEFEPEDIDQVPVGTYVEVQDFHSRYTSGEIVEVDEFDVVIETDDGEEVKKSISSLYNAEAKADQSLEQARETELSENPSQDDLSQRAEYLDFDDKPNDQKRGQFVREAIQSNADPEDVYEVFQEFDVRPSIDTVMEKAVKQSGASLFSETLDTDVLLAADRDIRQEISKADFKTFQQEYDVTDGQVSDIESSVSEWTGSSKNSGTVPLWAVAFEEGEDNIPDKIARQMDGVDAPDPELVDATKQYVEHTRDIMREMFGDSVKLYRGIGGSYGSERSNALQDEGEATVDHKAIESWSLSPETADSFAYGTGTVACREVSPDEMFISFANNVGFSSEFEIVASSGLQDYENVDPDGGDSLEPGTATVADNYSEKARFIDSMEDFSEYIE